LLLVTETLDFLGPESEKIIHKYFTSIEVEIKINLQLYGKNCIKFAWQSRHSGDYSLINQKLNEATRLAIIQNAIIKNLSFSGGDLYQELMTSKIMGKKELNIKLPWLDNMFDSDTLLTIPGFIYVSIKKSKLLLRW